MNDRAEPRLKLAARYFLSFAMVAVGVAHFVAPAPLVRIVPSFLPAPELLVYLSGVAEIALGAGLLFARTRLFAAWGLVALYVAVFPANINAAVNGIVMDPANPMPSWGNWARLPFQALFIAWAIWVRKP
jgi:uncharacterized membrane protein